MPCGMPIGVWKGDMAMALDGDMWSLDMWCPFVPTLVSIVGALFEQQPPVFGFGCVFGLELTLEGCVEVPSALLGAEQHEPPVLVLVSDGGGGVGLTAPLALPEQQEPPFEATTGAGRGAGFDVLVAEAAPFVRDVDMGGPWGNMGAVICWVNIGYMMG